MQSKTGVNIDTARTHLDKLGYCSKACRCKLILFPSNIAGLLCRINETSQTVFKKVMFTDKMAFRLGQGGRKRCIPKAGTAHLPQHLDMVFCCGGTLHIWGAIYLGYKLPLVRFQLAKARTVNGRKVAAQTRTADVYIRQILCLNVCTG